MLLNRIVEATTEQHSRWARSLAKAIEYLIAAGELFEAKIGVDEAKTRLDIGVPELAIGDHRPS